ncbi:MAG: PqqD family protein [Chloroflexi bacterium]|nr:PqqD family protein [Chloroflexota bacterium]
MNGGACFVACRTVVAAELGEEFVLLDTASGKYYGLEGAGARVWELLLQGHSADQICSTLISEYDAAEVPIRTDVSTFLRSMLDRGLIELAHS